MTWPFGTLTPLRYGLILADPPWLFKLFSGKGEGKSPQAHYACMGAAGLAALPVNQLAAPHCALIMWATWPMITDALALMKAWGFTYKTGGSWAKQSSTGNAWAFGTGYCFRSANEPFLLGTIGRPPVLNRSTRNLIVAPVRQHSRKPDAMHDLAAGLYPGPRAELFAREPRDEWDCWGNETDKFAAQPEKDAA